MPLLTSSSTISGEHPAGQRKREAEMASRFSKCLVEMEFTRPGFADHPMVNGAG